MISEEVGAVTLGSDSETETGNALVCGSSFRVERSLGTDLRSGLVHDHDGVGDGNYEASAVQCLAGVGSLVFWLHVGAGESSSSVYRCHVAFRRNVAPVETPADLGSGYANRCAGYH